MREAVIVSTARTPIGRANRGAFNHTHGANSTGRLPTELSESGRIDTLRSGPQAGKSVGICESGFGFRLIDRLGRSLCVRQKTGDPISGSGSGET